MDQVARHHLSAETFNALSRGEGSAKITREFWETEESRRLLLTSALLEKIAKRPDRLGPLPSATEVREVLSDAQRIAPEATRELLMAPGVGSGFAYTLRRLHGGAESTEPLLVDLGVVHAVALVAAARAGLTWSTRLPVRGGYVMLPLLGMAHFSRLGREATVEARTKGGRISLHDDSEVLHIPADDSSTWWKLRRIEAGDGDLRLSVWLDDLDPLRDLGDPVPPARLDQESFVRWHTLIQDAWALLCRDYPADAAAMAGGITSIVPLKHLPGWDTRSASSGEAFGGVMVSEPPDAVTMAVSLIHEYQHIKLGALLHLVSLTEADDGSLYYAPWRDDPRPLSGLLQGIYAFFGIARFWRTRVGRVHGADRALAAFEYAYARQQTFEAIRIALRAPTLTAAGRELVEGLGEQVDEWQTAPPEPINARIFELSRITADSHRIGWHLRHVRPRAEEIMTLAERMRNGGEPSPGSLAAARFELHPQLRWRQRIPAAARRMLSTGGNDAHPVDSLGAAENALLAGNASDARKAFAEASGEFSSGETTHISDDEARAWAGLAMSLEAEGDMPAAISLISRPDLVRAVYARVRLEMDTNPVDVARWLAPAVTPE